MFQKAQNPTRICDDGNLAFVEHINNKTHVWVYLDARDGKNQSLVFLRFVHLYHISMSYAV